MCPNPLLNHNLFIAILVMSLLTTTYAAPFASLDSDSDLIDISNITVFPEYTHNIRAGYLNLTAYNQAFYYIFCERYELGHLVRTTPTTILSSYG